MRPGMVVGVDLGGTKVLAAVVDDAGRVLAEAREATAADDGVAAVITRIANLVNLVIERAGGSREEISALTIGVPGSVSDAEGLVEMAPNLGWHNVALGRELERALGIKVFLDNDVRLAVLGEQAYGVGRGTHSMVGVYVGTGIGGGVVIGGELLRGGRGAAGEVGHMILKPNGPRCPCGQRGCAEALASRTAMERDVRKLIRKGKKSRVLKLISKQGRTRLTSSLIVRALKQKDPVMTKVMRRAQDYLGLLVANLVNALDPEVVVIGGGIAERMGEEFVAPIREAAGPLFFLQRHRENVRIVPTELKERAAPLGAALVARHRLAATSSGRSEISPLTLHPGGNG